MSAPSRLREVQTKGPVRTPISAVVLAALFVAGCASQPTRAAAGSSAPTASLAPGSGAVSSLPARPANSSLAGTTPTGSAPASSPASTSTVASSPVSSAADSGPDPCLAPAVEKAGTAPVPDPDAVSLRLCHPGGLKPIAGQSVLLTQDDATTIGRLLDLAPAGTANCEGPPDALLRFGYRDGTRADVEIFAAPLPDETGCDQSTASVAGHVWVLSPTLASFLEGIAIAPGVGATPPAVPDVTGLSLAKAADVLRKAGLTIHSGGRVTDPLLSADTVVLQDPPAGPGMTWSGTEVDVLLSQLPGPACSLTQLAFDYRGVQHGTGDAFSDLDVRNTGPAACTLSSPITIVGLNSKGAKDTSLEGFAISSDLVLTAHTPMRGPDGSVPIGEVIAWVPIQANVRDGPDAKGSCSNHLVVPANWLVTYGDGQKLVPNGTPGSTYPPMSACEGQLMSGLTPAMVTPIG
jgi:hypothetical protein